MNIFDAVKKGYCNANWMEPEDELPPNGDIVLLSIRDVAVEFGWYDDGVWRLLSAERVDSADVLGWCRGPEVHRPLARTTVAVIGCGKTKQNQAAPAIDLYTGSLFVARRDYVQKQRIPHVILSALHGIIGPNIMLLPYEFTIRQRQKSDRTAWGTRVAEALLLWMRSNAGDPSRMRIELHAGADYVDALDFRPLQAAGCRIVTPLQGLGIGEQLAWYKEHTPS